MKLSARVALATGLLALLMISGCSTTSPVKDCRASCQGCCTASGQCVNPGDRVDACGSAGEVCETCPVGATCGITRCEGAGACVTNGQACTSAAECCSGNCVTGSCVSVIELQERDAGSTTSDAGSSGDAGADQDAGADPDAGATDDGGTSLADAGTSQPDAGATDAGSGPLPDGGAVGNPDAGPPVCRANGATCTTGTQCCSSYCNPMGSCAFVPADGGACTPNGQACAASIECCSLSCNTNTGLCAVGLVCRANALPCSMNSECCSLLCDNGSCRSATDAGVCLGVGEACTAPSQCCSLSCNTASRRCL